ncbi:MAG: hypothetical protein CHACPFDD_00309 [Phycisphaerae bacterium]|nr:hypothetical protein [Phycisphaerae bacterium]
MSDCLARLPFRFGGATMRWAPMLTCRVRIDVQDGAAAVGHSADLLVPKWFDKRSGRTFRDDVNDLTSAARNAAAAVTAHDVPPMALFELWQRAHATCVGRSDEESQNADGLSRLARGFGVALVERALIDAVCRSHVCTFFQALRRDLLGFDAGAVHPELRGWSLAASLPTQPLRSVRVRHTLGLSDALRAADISAAERLSDGLPQALDEAIRAYGLTSFKLKLSGDVDHDAERLRSAWDVIERNVGAAPLITLDGNEQFRQLAAVLALLERLAADERGRRLLGRVSFIEQPLPRDAMNPLEAAMVASIERFAPLLIDEADDRLESFPRAVACGYRGVSVKNCKGVIRALLNRGLCELYSRRRGTAFFQSAEDLTNLPVLALQQDLATVATLGLSHVERNGQHYFRGLDHLPSDEARDAAAAHPDLYRADARGAFLRIENGCVALDSLQRAGYGYDLPIRVEQRTPLAAWSFPEHDA